MSDSAHSFECRRCFCRQCDRFVIAGSIPFRTGLHANAVAATCFLWLPVAVAAGLWHAAMRAGYRCPNCGCRCQ